MRIAVVTPLLPLPGEPFRGLPIYESIRALKRYADIEVFCPTAKYPFRPAPPSVPASPVTQVDSDTPEAGKSCGCIQEVTHFSYPALPVLTRTLNGDTCARRLYPFLAKCRADISLNYWLYPEGYAAVKVSHDLGIPAVLSSRGSDLRRISTRFTRALVAAALREAESVFTVSNELRQRAVALGADPERTVTILNGCDRTIFHPLDRQLLRQELAIAPGDRVVLYVGRLERSKGLNELLQAFSALSNEIPTLRLAFAGSGAFADTIRTFSATASLERPRILLPGTLSPREIARWMSAADLFCLPSHSEGCPNVLIEAISCGCPSVATTVGGIPELTTDQCAILVPPADPARLAEAIRAGLARSWDRQAISTSLTRTWDDVARETYDLCEKTVRAASRKRPAKRRAPSLRIGVVTPYFPTSADSYRGHSAVHTLRFLKEMADVEVICPLVTYPPILSGSPPVMPAAGFHPAGIRTTYFPYPAVPFLSRPVNGMVCERRLLPILRASRPDVILNYWLYPEGFSAVRAGRSLGIPVVVGSIGSDLRRIGDPFTRRLVRQTLHEASAVITVSEDLRQLAIAFGVPPERITTILNGYDDSIFHPGDREEARRKVGFDAPGQLLLFVGSLFKSKGLKELLQAFSGLSRSLPAVRLAVIGEGPYRGEILRLAGTMGIADRLLLPGRLPSSEVASWMRAANVFCLPSHSEGCPNVVVEAIACGLPVVATGVGGIPELVGPEQGILVPLRDPERLRAALEESLCRTWDSRRIAMTLQRTWEDVAAETLAVCSRVTEAIQSCSVSYSDAR
jgi:glycosyltransferase involved in cell wall biosynthesis